ncbi:hypothetical protein [Kitasatospora sp. NPDC015120]|uniref:hypothetical protein n=1 Tax=Kitasatospora sp. NPDC015120 TaxID=3364023 RepID=UPI0036F4814A
MIGAAAVRLGHALDVAGLQAGAKSLAAGLGSGGAGVIATAALAAGLAAAAAGLAARGLGKITEVAALTDDWQRWPAPLGRPVAGIVRRRRAGHLRLLAREAARQDAREPRPLPDDAPRVLRRTARILTGPPVRASWSGDRILGTGDALRAAYGLDLAGLWPSLWLVVPDADRAELNAERAAVGSATGLFGWGWLYLLLGSACWPLLFLAGGVLLVARYRLRAATAGFAEHVRRVSQLYAPELARRLGSARTGPLDRATVVELHAALGLPAPEPEAPGGAEGGAGAP